MVEAAEGHARRGSFEGSAGWGASLRRCSPELLVAALVLAVFAPSFPALLRRWFHPGGYYHHAPLVPFVCGWLLWRDRRRLQKIPRGSSPLGLALCALALWVFVAGLLESSAALQRYAFFGALLGAALVLVGRRLVLTTWFVWVFALLFMIPPPALLLTGATVQLKLAVARFTHAAVEALGIAAVLRGDTIHFAGGLTVLVDDVCSGLRSLIALLAIASLFAVVQSRRWKAWLIVALSVPIALLSNAVRALALCLLAARGSQAATSGFWHEATGIVIYCVAVSLLYGVHSLPDWGSSQADGSPAPDGGLAPPDAPASGGARAPKGACEVEGSLPAAPVVGALWRRLLVVELALGLAVTVGLGSLSPAPPEAGGASVTRSIPLALGAWRGRDLENRLAGAREVLQTDDLLLRRYARSGDAAPVEVFVLHTDSSAGVHPPTACYTLQGYMELERGSARLQTRAGELSVSRAIISQAGEQHLVYFWYRLNGEHYAGGRSWQAVPLVRRLLTLRGSRDGSTVRISTPLTAGLADAEARIAAFAAEALAEVVEPLP